MRKKFVWLAGALIAVLASLEWSRSPSPASHSQEVRDKPLGQARDLPGESASKSEHVAEAAESAVRRDHVRHAWSSSSFRTSEPAHVSPAYDPGKPTTGDVASPASAAQRPDGASIDQHIDDMLANMRKQKIPPSMVVAHDELQSESVDPAWGPMANQQIQSYLTDAFGDRFDIRGIDCRSDMCEIRVAGRTLDQGQRDQDAQDWQMQFLQMAKQPFWQTLQFSEPTCMVADTQGLPTFLCFIVRSR